MTNADKFKRIFGIYATELWAKPEKEFLEWLNADVPNSDDGDTISRQAAIDALNEYFARIGKLKRRGLTKGEKAISLDTVGAIKTLPSAQPEPCEDTVKSHSEKDILNMCISLLDEMVGYFGEYMEWIGYEPTEEEKECGYFGMTYFHIVQKLFLYHTTHSGGTSTFEKCHELGVDDPSDGVRFPLWKEEEGDTE